jgi:hypothetical protein
MSVTPAVPYLLLGLQGVQWAVGNSRGARKLARTPHINQKKKGYQFCSVSSGIAKIFHTNLKNKTKRNKFHLILNLGPFRIFRLNSARNVPVSFHMFRSTLEKSLNQIEHCSI